jgi:hypothetical protein
MKHHRPRAGPSDLAQRVRNVQYILDVEAGRALTVPEVNDRPEDIYFQVNEDVVLFATAAISTINHRRFVPKENNHASHFNFS